jgi:signal transduction histidine kinase
MTSGSADDREQLALLVHEVRSPTAALDAIATVVADTSIDEESRRKLLRLAVDACCAIERIVDDASPGALRVEDVDVATVARAAVAAAVLGGARARLEVDPRSPTSVRGDAVRLRQAIDNILLNAIAHSPAGDEVVVAVARDGSAIAVSIRDSGPGIDVTDHKRIFDPGVRVDASRPGSGLGLSIARAIVEAHGGTIRIESAPGSGAAFILTLPTADA